jgi:hypothetical protein
MQHGACASEVGNQLYCIMIMMRCWQHWMGGLQFFHFSSLLSAAAYLCWCTVLMGFCLL